MNVTTAKPACVNTSQTQPSSWKKCKLTYQSVVLFQVLVLGFNIATFLYIKRHKIPISTILAESSVGDYLIFGQYSVAALWTAAAIYCIPHGHDLFPYLIIVGNIYGLAVLAFLFYSIFPVS